MGLHYRYPCRSSLKPGSAYRLFWSAALLAGCMLAGKAVGMPASLPTPIAGAEAPEPWRQWRGVLFRIVAPQALAAAPVLDIAPLAGVVAESEPSSATSPKPVSFMLGTIHFGSPDELNLDSDILFEAMRHMHVLVNEVDGSTPWDERKERYRSLSETAGLPGLIGPAAFSELSRLLPQAAPDWLHRLKPWAALALLEARGEVMGEQTLDKRLELWAQELNMPAMHLETLDAQLAALDCVPPGEHAMVLQQRLRTPWLFAEQSARVLDYYRSRNLAAWLDEIDAMVGLDAKARAVEDRARRCLLEARNERWLPQLEVLLRRGGAFVAVGAIHLTGASGLLEQLRQRGFLIVAEPL